MISLESYTFSLCELLDIYYATLDCDLPPTIMFLSDYAPTAGHIKFGGCGYDHQILLLRCCVHAHQEIQLKRFTAPVIAGKTSWLSVAVFNTVIATQTVK